MGGHGLALAPDDNNCPQSGSVLDFRNGATANTAYGRKLQEEVSADDCDRCFDLTAEEEYSLENGWNEPKTMVCDDLCVHPTSALDVSHCNCESDNVPCLHALNCQPLLALIGLRSRRPGALFLKPA